VTDRLLEASEVAELLSVPVSWVREATRNGAIPAIPIGRYWRYRESSILAWLAELRRNREQISNQDDKSGRG
jgi:excisionase family DNA binding protein